MAKSLQEVLRELDGEFDKSIVDWMISLYDPKSGGTYYSCSARDNDQFAPDIESVTQIASAMRILGLTTDTPDNKYGSPEWYNKRAVQFIRERQDPDDGYFYDPQYKTIANKAKIERNTSFALSFLRRNYDAEPFYKTPMQRVAEKTDLKAAEAKNVNTGVGVYESKESFLRWLDEITAKRNSYCWGSDIASAHSIIKAYGHEETLVDWLKERQYPNGTWEKEFDMTAVNGALKMCGFFNQSNGYYPNYRNYIRNVIEFTKTFDPVTAAATWNPLGSTRVIINNLPELDTDLRAELDAGIIEMISNVIVKMRLFRQPDGGYGYLRKGSSTYSNDVVVSLGSPEGDVNAMTLIALTYSEAYELSGTPITRVLKKYSDYYWEKMKEREDSER